jgi:multidrug transporter EmrE-like cation transporter
MSISKIILLSVAEIVGDFGYKSYARTGATGAFAQGTVGYLGVIYFLIKSLREGNILYVNGMWDGVSAALESLAAYFILGERLSRPIEYIGLALVIVGILMLHSPKGKIPY